MVTYEQREEAYTKANEFAKELYDSYESGLAIATIADKHLVQNKINFSIAIGDVILGLVPQEKLPDLLIERLQITRPEAMKVTADVLDFLAPLSNPQAAQPAPTAPAATVAPAAVVTASVAAPAADSQALAAEIAQAEAALESVVQPMRTMAHDMEVARHPHTEATHQAVDQADLLHANAKNPDASWETS